MPKRIVIEKKDNLFALINPSINELRKSLGKEFGVEFDGKAYLAPVEVLYLIYLGYEVILGRNNKPLDFNKVINLTNDKELWVKFVVYYDLRNRGRRVKVRSDKGFTFSDPQSNRDVEVVVMEESRKLKAYELIEIIDKYTKMNKDVLLAIADRHGDVTYYQLSRIHPMRSGKSVEENML